jgi:foldase protein PrsA
MIKPRLTLVLVALCVLVAAGCGGGSKVPSGAVAVVNGQPITLTELDAVLAREKKQATFAKQQFPEVGTSQYQLEQQRIAATLVRQTEYEKEAAARGVTVSTAEVDKAMADIEKRYAASGRKEGFDAYIKANGYDPPSLRKDVKSQLLRNKLYAQILKKVRVTAADEKAFYEKNKATGFQTPTGTTVQITVPESRTVRHILVKTRALALELYDRLQKGADFATLAKKYSQDTSTAKVGGKLTIARGQTVQPFDDTAFLLTKNHISKPLKTQFGWHLVQPISDIEEGHTKPLAEVRQEIHDTLLQQRQSDAITAFNAELDKKYDGKVHYADGYAPPAQATTPATTTG